MKQMIKKYVHKLISMAVEKNGLMQKSAPETKIAIKRLMLFYQNKAREGIPIPLKNTGFRNYSQFEEDGLLLYIFSTIGEGQKLFVDIGSSDGINSNCANLCINCGWHGLFIDGDEKSIAGGREFYRRHPDTFLYPPRFVHAFINAENINNLILDAGFSGEVDLVSIDIDGNDYYIWKALEVVRPRVVIIETHVEFGKQSIVVPYDPDYIYPGKHPEYHGASPVAMEKLATQKGYHLVGANRYGFNTIYVRNDIPVDLIPEVTVDEILEHPRNEERIKLFKEIENWKYIQV